MTTNKRKALGRGLEELFNNEPIEYTKIEEKIYESTSNEEIVDIKLSELRANPYQPRKHFDEKALQELSDSIKEHGVIQPIIVKKSIKGYEIIAGERRVKASRLANLETVPAIVREFTENEMMEIALLENLQREDLNAIEEAEAYEKIRTTLDLTQEKLAKRVGKSRSHITNMLGLLTLPNEVKELISQSKITMGHARVISKLENANEQVELATKIVRNNLSVRDIEELSKNKTRTNKIKRVVNKEFNHYEEMLIEKLGTKVKISNNKIVMNFNNKKDLERILNIINIGE